MQAVRTIIDRQLILLAMQLEASLANAVAVSSDKCREIRLWRIYYIVDIVVTLNNVGSITISIRNHNSNQSASIVRDSHFITFTVSQDVEVGFFTGYCRLKVGSLQSTDVFCLGCVHHLPSF